MPVSGISLMTPPMMMKACRAKMLVSPVASSREKSSRLGHGHAQAAIGEDQVQQDDAHGAHQPQLLADGGEDEVRFQVGDDGVARSAG